MLIEMFSPYMYFISFFLTVIINVYLLSKNVNWIVLVVGNLLIIVVLEFLGLGQYNFLNKIIEWIFDFVGDIIKSFWDATVGKLFPDDPSLPTPLYPDPFYPIIE